MAARDVSGREVLEELPGTLVDAVEHGEVFTRRWVVETILDLVGYTADRDLAELVVVEPACGAGAFLGPIAERLSASCRVHGRSLIEAASSVAAFDLLDHNVRSSRKQVAEQLLDDGWPTGQVDEVVEAWIVQGDYLLATHELERVDFVVCNPPYIRLEDVPDQRMRAYRSRCSTMGGRADIYVGFYEVGLRSLRPGGRLGFICADRWMRNQYGRKLRKLITNGYSLDVVATLHDVDAFDEQVSAYPAITVVRRGEQGRVVAAGTTSRFGPEQASELRTWIDTSFGDSLVKTPAFDAVRLPRWFSGEDSWPAASPARLAVLKQLSDRFGLLEDVTTGTRVGIGVATGADDIFITDESGLADVEADRLLPLAMVRDTTSGRFDWHGTYLVNPWNPQGELVGLEDYPRLARHFERNSGILRGRHIARKQPNRWYKTIDKVNHQLTAKPKLLFPDLKLTIHPVLDPGGYYPHHNLYYVISDTWDLRVLGGLLLSKVAEAFVAAYAVRMRGGTLRFQAQYLRKIRVPDPATISDSDATTLADAFDRRDVDAATRVALRVYGLAELPE